MRRVCCSCARALCPRAAPAAPAGKLGEAEPLCREALAVRRETLGDRHPDTLTSINNMAGLLQAQGAPGPHTHTSMSVRDRAHLAWRRV
jgi:hypothetical protein